MTMLSAFKVLLHHYSGQTDICVGTPIANRRQQEVEGLIGFFANTVALRSEVFGNQSFTSLLQKVRATTLQSYEHQDVPFEKVIEAVVKGRDMSRSPLFQVMFMFQNELREQSVWKGLNGLELSQEVSSQGTSRFEMTFSITEGASGIRGSVEYCTDLFKEETIRRMIGHYTCLLESIVLAPSLAISKLNILTSAERKELLEDFNLTRVAYPLEETLVDLFEKQVESNGSSVAVIFEEESMTYSMLNERSNQLAHYLVDQGVSRNSLVGICIQRSSEMLISLLAVLKAGGAYVPLDPSYPIDRLHFYY